LSDGVRRLSDLPEAEARAELLACCGARRWVERMLGQRPFKDRTEVFEAAAHIWWSLERRDWQEAFAAHPRIGGQADRRSGGQEGGRGAAWSEQEQAQVAEADHAVTAALAEANREYEGKFGHIYIVRAAGRSAEEMLALARARLRNDAATELRVAAAEQLAITTLRLEKLLTL
jgi:2-oxo-4-hydroxy-4-carboxy-5-ureidoimidazoline decarboxylase